jgi:hypothetical protein
MFRLLPTMLLLGAGLPLALGWAVEARAPGPPGLDALTGPRSPLAKDWIGSHRPSPDTPILVMAGHADSQGMEGAGTAGEAVDLLGAAPMDPRMRDELFWNRLVSREVVRLGRERGLNIQAYEPLSLRIPEHDDPRTNWSVGHRHVRRGGYAVEIHFDAYGPEGFGSGVIPRLLVAPNRIDERLAAAFGSYPLWFRGGLGAPRRGITILEIGKLEGALEQRLRNTATRGAVIEAIARRVVDAMDLGIDPPALSPPPRAERNAPPASDPPASPGAG